SDEGIAFLGSSSNQCNNNIVTDCEFYDNCDGIELQYSSNNVISNCKFYDNTHAGIDAIGSSNNNNVISGCDLSNNKAFGIFFSRSTDNTISKCTFSENKIMATASKNIKVENCKLDGIYLKDKSSMTIEDCGDVLESKIKTVDSDYVLSSVEEIKTRFDSLQERKDTIKNSIFLRIMTILSFIRSR
ncbi:MAG: right-handed parallel beta-helix repeat-containing protein, partial [Thermoplasmatales archaeon]|nr:right-handed parallel beta-helix repeat-containing protein [Thermoplasmatales archaeon]